MCIFCLAYRLICSVTNMGMHCAAFARVCHLKMVRGGNLVVPPWYLLLISHQYQYAGAWAGHVASIWHLVWFDQLPIRVCTITLLLLNVAIFQKMFRGGTLVVPLWYPLFITHQYKYAGTWTGHVASIWHIVWFDQLPIRVCTTAPLLMIFFIFQKNSQKGYPNGTPMVPPFHNSSIQACRHMDRTCSLHMVYSLIWSVTNKGLYCCNAFGEIFKNCQGDPLRPALTPPQIWVSTLEKG